VTISLNHKKGLAFYDKKSVAYPYLWGARYKKGDGGKLIQPRANSFPVLPNGALISRGKKSAILDL
jgi:hypothetical protein